VTYISKVEDKLTNKKLFNQVKDPTKKIKESINDLADQLFKKKKITLKEKHEFTSIENVPTIIGQPKIHKENDPMR